MSRRDAPPISPGVHERSAAIPTTPYRRGVGQGEWARDAENWLSWARTPAHDAYWYYRGHFFDSIVPPPRRRTLEVGCGEGRVARDLAARGHRVTAVDTAYTLLHHAREAGSAGEWSVADGASLPFPDRCFDTVVAYNALQVVADMAGTVQEVARVLVPGGHLCVCVSHPVTDLGRFLGDEEDAPYRMRSAYFDRRRIEDTVERGGLTMTFRGWTYTLEDYASALAHAGFAIEAIGEPRPDRSGGRFTRWTRVPLFMTLRAVRQ